MAFSGTPEILHNNKSYRSVIKSGVLYHIAPLHKQWNADIFIAHIGKYVYGLNEFAYDIPFCAVSAHIQCSICSHSYL